MHRRFFLSSWSAAVLGTILLFEQKIRRKGTTKLYSPIYDIRRTRCSQTWNCHNYSECISINSFIRYELILFKFKFMSFQCTKLFDALLVQMFWVETLFCPSVRLRFVYFVQFVVVPFVNACVRLVAKVTLIDLLCFLIYSLRNGRAFSIDRTHISSRSRERAHLSSRSNKRNESKIYSIINGTKSMSFAFFHSNHCIAFGLYLLQFWLIRSTNWFGSVWWSINCELRIATKTNTSIWFDVRSYVCLLELVHFRRHTKRSLIRSSSERKKKQQHC